MKPSSFLNLAALPRAGALLLLGCVVALTGCAGYQAFREGNAKLAEGQTEPGLTKLREAMEKEPQNNEYRRSYYMQRDAQVNNLLREAEAALEAGQFASAKALYAKAARLDPSNPRAGAGVGRAEAAERHWIALDEALALAKAGKLDAAVSKTQQVVSEDPNYRRATQQLRQLMRQQADATGKELGIYPKLKAAYRVPVSLSFTNASLLQVFEALKQASGLNYMIERDVKPDLRVTLSVTNKPVADIVRLLLATNQLESRVLDGDTLLIYPNTPAKAAEYREMVVRTFYLNNADATKVANAVRTIAKVRDVVVDEKLNMLMVRDSAEGVRLAEKVIAAQDIAEPEVMLELEVLEVSASRLLELGIRWPDSLSASVSGRDGVLGQLRLDELRENNRNRGMVTLNTSDPLISAQLRSTKGDASLLANPRVRVRNKQSAKILIGERVPVITTTTTANVGTAESVNYLDVGLKLDIEPTVSLDDEVSMKIALEVSNILETVARSSGTQAYRLGTRNTSTSLRVRDGETNILAGLIQRDERRSNTGVPGFNELPVVSKLFGAAQDSDTRTEIVLLITPHIVRNLDVPGVGQQEFLSGTESSAGASPIQLGTPMNAGPVPVGMPRPGGVPTFSPVPRPVPPSAPTPQPPATPPAFTPPPLVPSSPSKPE
ncbi:MAG: general secretion pathway protein GspD [Planctomycetes bacterium]|nr:general secretion pathway protein GspD [Planctomycetota bacterium]